MYESPISLYRSVDKTIKDLRKRIDDSVLLEVREKMKIEINAEELRRALRYDRQQYERGYKDGIRKAATPEARWIICSDGYYPYCSKCKAEPPGRAMTSFCPECGARMTGWEAES